MTRFWVGDEQVAVTLFAIPEQEIVRQKTSDKDGYTAIVVGAQKQVNTEKVKGNKVSYKYQCEFKVAEDSLAAYATGTTVTAALLSGVDSVGVVSISKGKGFQGGIKRHHFAGGPESHGSKFHRALGSTGNRKPRRTNKNQPMAGHMGDERKTLKSVPVVEVFEVNGQQMLALKGSVPGAYNSYLQLHLV
ncbi:MAG: 50S ribosomal protein L3 [Candidatus Peribacteria bacterium]|nr:MAG: 50S ribosomal protein L3 [Candidatus Peribacteria bacterium]